MGNFEPCFLHFTIIVIQCVKLPVKANYIVFIIYNAKYYKYIYIYMKISKYINLKK